MDYTSDDLPARHQAYLLARMTRKFHGSDEEELRAWADECNDGGWGFPDGASAFLDPAHLERLLVTALASASPVDPLVF